ncbi:MAG TPA: tetratricopeptide repeat protein, partial [Polyangia bacterium]
ARPAPPAEAASYESLLAQADKLLGNGANERALRIYERALALKPGAPDALTGIAYAHLDRGRTGPAIEYFNRASAGTPHAPALFGLGQAYRAAGDYNRARETYRRYLSLFPSGPEASAAERQLRSMPTAGEPGGGGGGEVSAPASILQEGGNQEPTRPREGGGTAPGAPPQPFDAPTP